MLVETAIADAYGAAFEYAVPTADRPNTVEGYHQHPRHTIIPGCYTDDTQMSLAIAEAMLVDPALPRELVAEKFVECFHRDPRRGYAYRFYDFLTVTKSGKDFIRTIVPNSEKSGAAMRAGPIGYYNNIPAVLNHAREQATLTHNTFGGIISAQAAALMAHYFIYNKGRRSELGEFISDTVQLAEFAVPWHGKVKARGIDAVRAAITAIEKYNDLKSILRHCIHYGGDTDTVATIALAAASQSSSITNTLPMKLYLTLENGPYGRDYLRMLSVSIDLFQNRKNLSDIPTESHQV